jgi:hypothetical protein
MNTLELLGIASLLITAGFTWWAVRSGADPTAAIIEAWANVALGFSLNFAANPLLIPLMSPGGHMSASSNFWGGCVYTAISVLRSAGIRMGLGAKIHRFAKWMTAKITARALPS